jgi:hypothetical protein
MVNIEVLIYFLIISSLVSNLFFFFLSSFTSAILSIYSNLLFVLFHLDRSFRKLCLNTINSILVGMISYLPALLFV